MNEKALSVAYEILNKAAAVCKFLFFSRTGLLLLCGGLFCWLALCVVFACIDRKRACAAAGKKFHFIELILFFIKSAAGKLGLLATALPIIAGVLIAASVTVGAQSVIQQFKTYAEASQRVAELRTVVKNLERQTLAAEITVTARTTGNDGRPLTSCSIAFYDDSTGGNDGQPVHMQNIVIPGKEIYVASIVYNFDYSEIAAGEKLNLCIPYCIHSDLVARKNGIPLECHNQQSIPHWYVRSDSDIYGIAPDIFRQRVKELTVILSDTEKCRSEGIRSEPFGCTIHKETAIGDTYSLYIQQTGGMTLKKNSVF